jgi:hypothetical protein
MQIKFFFNITNIIKLCKIIGIYVCLLILFYLIQNDKIRFLCVLLIFLLCILLFNIEYKIALLYIFIALCCALTESIYITFLTNTWVYKAPNIINIPYWLIPIWGIAIVLITEIINIFTK